MCISQTMRGMSKRFAAASIIVCAFLIQGEVRAEEAPDRLVEYKAVGKAKLSLSIFNPSDHKASDQKPAIVFFFGGGWKSGTPRQFYKQSRYLAERGMVAICADYRTAKSHKTSPQECVKDGKSAIRWVRKNAKKLGVNPKQIAAGGGSAGGHVAAATALVKAMDEEGEDTSVSCRPDALVLFNPVFDNGPGGYGHDRVVDYWKQISPMHNIDDTAPPTVVFLGTKDKLIPVATAEAYKKKMEQHGKRCDLHLYPEQPHGFFNKAKFDETLQETDRFLVSLGFLKAKS